MNEFTATDEDLEDIKYDKDINLPEIKKVEESVEVSSTEDMLSDYNKIRKNLHNILDIGNDSLIEVMKLAKAADTPRCWEVLSNLMTTIAKTSLDLKELHKPLEKGSKKSEEAEDDKSVTNILAVGSTKEISDMLKQIKSSE